MQHVATWKEGDEKWAYHPDAFAHIATHKVSLDPYRLESRRILACIKDVLPAPPVQRVEKASVDEVFLDLSAQIHSILLERYPELQGPPPYDDPTEFLPRPPTTALDWNTDALVDLDRSETEDDDPDWDDIAILVGSEIVRSVRGAIRERLHYTCSAGIARNKMIAKLGSGHKKPNQQTIVRNRAVQHFLGDFKFTKIRNLGGKLGDEVVAKFETDQVEKLLGVSIEQLKLKLGDDTGSWVYHIIRGDDNSEVNSRTEIKSMLSAKSFRPTINTYEQAVRWLRIFVADIFSRLVEQGVLENKRRPRTINLHHRQGAQTRSRQAPIPTGRPIDENLLFEISKNILGQIVIDGRAWPCSNLSLSVGGFEDGPVGNRGIGSFLVRGDEAKTMQATTESAQNEQVDEIERLHKRIKPSLEPIQKFLTKRERSINQFEDFSAEEASESETTGLSLGAGKHQNPEVDGFEHELGHDFDHGMQNATNQELPLANKDRTNAPSAAGILLHQRSITPYFCDRCQKAMPMEQREEHQDWHFAGELQKQEQGQIYGDRPIAKTMPESLNTSKASGNSKRPGSNKGSGTASKSVEKGQSRLTFGR